MDKLFDAVFANILIWSTLVCIVLTPKPDVDGVKRKLASTEYALSTLRSDLKAVGTNITAVGFGEATTSDLGWSFLFIQVDSSVEPPRVLVIKG